MHSVDLPAGFPVRFTATAPVGADIHRWKVRVVGAEDLGVAAHELSFGSRIGGEDRDQRIDIPAQDKDCRLEIAAQHQNGEAWDEDRSSIAMDSPSLLELGFDAPGSPQTDTHAVLLSFHFKVAVRPL